MRPDTTGVWHDVQGVAAAHAAQAAGRPTQELRLQLADTLTPVA